MKHRPAALVFIFITALLDVVALGIIIPVFPKLVLTLSQGGTAQAAQIFGIFGTVWAFMHFFFSPLLGALSDRYGRRPVILISNFGLGLDYVLMALAPSLQWLFIGRVISGVTAASITAVSAYIADVTPPEKRAAGYGMLGAAFGLGFILGPALGGIFGGIDPRLPFWIAAGASLLNGFYGLFVLPESLPVERRSAFRWRAANPVGSLRLLRSHRRLTGLAAVGFLNNLAHVALPSVFVLYAGHRYGWGETTVGLCLALVGFCAMIVQGALIQPVVTRFGERRALLIGLGFGVIGFGIYGMAETATLFWWGVPWMALWGLASPSLQGLMTQMVEPTEQGRLQGANSSLMGIAELVGPILFTVSFSVCISGESLCRAPGAPFLIASGLLLLGMLLAWRITRGRVPMVSDVEASTPPRTQNAG